jgi:bifunctional DNA-binding transcriptional regulator/antitoxin component of YhaV-PrlF toxin-antitoxin module
MQTLNLGTRKVSWAKKQIVLPEAVLNKLELEEGDCLSFVLDDSHVVLVKVKP